MSYCARKIEALSVILSISILVVGSNFVAPTETTAAAVSSRYTSCLPGSFGLDCAGVCKCADFEDCSDGLVGDGACTCAFNQDTRCGIPKRLVPAPEYPAVCSIKDAWDDDDNREGEHRYLCTLDQLIFDNSTLRHVSIDKGFHRAPRSIPNATAVRVLPMPLRATDLRLVAFDPATARLLKLAPNASVESGFTEVFSGRALFPGSQPFAHVYGGHQFGTFRGQLGDGRAVSLGELGGWEVSLKGAGRTPLSRAGDGRAVLQSVCREFLGGIALNALGVPTTHSLAVIGSDDSEDALLRDEWYTGELLPKPAGILVRVAPTFFRFGTFELAARRQGVEGVTKLAKHALKIMTKVEAADDRSTSYLDTVSIYYDSDKLFQVSDAELQEVCFLRARGQPSCAVEASKETSSSKDTLLCLLERVVARSAALLASWTGTGFVHGVMNTDNMSILGITLDLNVFGFLEAYDETFVPNFIDDEARYAFGKQMHVMLWNLNRLADALSGIFPGEEYRAKSVDESDVNSEDSLWLSRRDSASKLHKFKSIYETCLDARQRIRLGLPLSNVLHSDGTLECEEDEHDRKYFDAEEGADAEILLDGTYASDAADRSGGSDPTRKLTSEWIDWLRLSRADFNRAHRALGDLNIAEFVQLRGQSGAASDHAKNADDDTNGVEGEEAWVRRSARDLIESAGVSKTMVTVQSDVVVRTLESWLGRFLDALSTAASDSSFSPHRWQIHMRAVNPVIVLRTRALRKLTQYAAENVSDGAQIFAAITEMVRHPFNTSSSLTVIDNDIDAIALNSLSKSRRGLSADSCEVANTSEKDFVADEYCALSSFGMETLLTTARGFLHAASEDETSSTQKTSCGGQ